MSIPRAEHPQPQWERTNWKNLNGTWEFEFDFGNSAIARNLWEKESFDNSIVVPFCPESRLSGIAYTDFISGAAYRRHFCLGKEEIAGRVLLHFGAVDYKAEVYVNGQSVGSHKGGYTSFSFDITEFVSAGDNVLFVSVADDVRSGLQPRGKQADKFASNGCDYTRTTGIWQTVWLEFLPTSYIESARFFPDPYNACILITGTAKGEGALTVSACWKGKTVGSQILSVKDGFFSTQLPLSEVHMWEPGKGGLYDLFFDFGPDHVKSYFGMRTVRLEGKKFMLNDKSLFQRFVLDQGFYPEGIYTAPSEEDLVKDIELSLAAGFNGARLHEKVFEPRFLYHCDRMGYLVWEEYPNWGLDHSHPLATEIYMNEWQEAVSRDFNHPAIIGWCPFNETWEYWEEKEKNALISSIHRLTRQLDPTRPCIDTSGNYHVATETTVYDIHDYDQDPESFRERWDAFCEAARTNGGSIPSDSPLLDPEQKPFFAHPYHNQPIFISEWGGIQWVTNAREGWGYGNAPATPEEFFSRYKGLAEAMLNNEGISGFCYTQLYDIEQEINGLYTYDRQPKFDIHIIREINQQPAKIEQ